MASRSGDGDPTSESALNAAKVPVPPSAPTTVGEELEWATRVLETVGVPEPAREAAALLASVLGLPSVALEPDSPASLAAIHVDRFLAAIVRRTRDESPRS
jgi:hypothetical protein